MSGGYPPGFFDRADEHDDAEFYRPLRLVTHIDNGAIAGVGELYTTIGVTGDVLDLMSSWVSHFERPPSSLVALGMNEQELSQNAAASSWIVHDLNVDPVLPFADASFDDVLCCASVDYLVRPLEVFTEVARVLRRDGRFVVTFSNRCFPTKAIRGWLMTDDDGHIEIVRSYFAATAGWRSVDIRRLIAGAPGRDPLYAVIGVRSGGTTEDFTP